jgi:hypothetical protein
MTLSLITLTIMADHCYSECRYAECRVLFIFMLNVILRVSCRIQ